MKKFYGIVLLTALFMNLAAQKKPEKAPVNPDFIRYMKEKEGYTKKAAGKYGTGYIPSPLNLHFNIGHGQEHSKKSTKFLPPQYDLRDEGYVTRVKDQGSAGACLSFSTMGAIESRWLKMGYGSYDLSEQNLATCHGFELGINDGGTFAMATAYLSRLSGPVLESSHPYNPSPDAVCKTTGLSLLAYVPSVVWLPDDIKIIKQAILDYGAVSASIYTGGAFMSQYLNPTDHTFYYNGTTSPDHAVLIVGWDNNMPVSGGNSSPKGTVGAWIVKNSWGDSWADNGYFYVSYKDTRFLSSSSIFPERAELDEIDKLYMYDRLGATTSYGFRKEDAYGLARFESDTENFIKRVGTFVNSSGSVLDIEIYENFQGDSLLTGLIASSYNNMVKFPGYYTFDIPALVNGEFYVKIKYHTPGYLYPVPAEAEISYQGEAYALPSIEESGTYWIKEEGEEWMPMGSDITDYEADLCIRAYADAGTSLNAFFTADRKETCIGTEVNFTDASNGEVSSYLWDFGEGAIPATATTKGPHAVTYTSTGLKDVSLIITGPGGTKIMTRKNYIEAVDALDVFLPYSRVLLVNGKSLNLTAFGADQYSWSPSEGLNTTSGQSVVASPVDTITYTVHGTMGTCTGMNAITINVVENPPNDDVCEALELDHSGYIGNFTNQYATVEDGEPAPPEGSCDKDMEWCIEGGLQNSVWFWFTAPSSGKVSINTVGMDNQIAVYKSGECDSIFSKSVKMVAAFDDYYGADKGYAAAIEQLDVVPGEKYFVQIDGSAGGEEGNFDLYFYDHPLGADKVSFHGPSIRLYPNPGEGIFYLELDQDDTPRLNLQVYDVTGRIVYSEEYTHFPGNKHELNLHHLQKGVYYLKMTGSGSVFTQTLLVN